jgi:hypothetical protein
MDARKSASLVLVVTDWVAPIIRLLVGETLLRGVSSNGTENRRKGFRAVYLLHSRLA